MDQAANNEDFFKNISNFISEKLQAVSQMVTEYFSKLFNQNDVQATGIGGDTPSPMGSNEPRAAQQPQNARAVADDVFDRFDKNSNGKLGMFELIAMKDGLANDSRFAGVDEAQAESLIREKMSGGVTRDEFREIADKLQSSMQSSQANDGVSATAVSSGIASSQGNAIGA